MSIQLSSELTQALLDHAERSYPHESCGFIIGTIDGNRAVAESYVPANNQVETNARRRFLIDPMAYSRVEDQADEMGKSIVSIVHSHPDHPDRPSEFDRAHAMPGLSYIIVSVRAGKAESHRSWQLSPDRKRFNPEDILSGGPV